MDTEAIIGIVAAGIGVVSTVVLLVLLTIGVISLRDIRRLLTGRPGDRG